MDAHVRGNGRDLTRLASDHGMPSPRAFAVLDHLAEGCSVIGFDWTYLYVNEAMARLEGREPQDLLGRTVQETHPGIEESPLFPRYRRCLEERSHERFEVETASSGGQARRHELSLSPFEEGILVLGVDVTERRRAELALRNEAAELHSVLDDMTDVYFRADLAGRFRLMSRNAPRVYGYDSVEEMLDRPALALYRREEDRRRLLEDLAVHGRVGDREIEGVRKDGSGFWVSMNVHLVHDEAGRVVGTAGVIRDVTERRRVERALSEERWRLASIIEGTHVGTWEWNVQTGETVYNETWAEIVGYRLEELAPVSIGTWASLAHPDDLEESGVRLRRHFAGEVPYYDFDCRMRHKDGHWVTVHDRGKVVTWTADGKPLMMFGTHTDITDRKRAEDALRTSEARLRSVLDCTPVPVAINDDGQNITYLNQAFVRTFGYTAEEIPTLHDWWPRAYPDPAYRESVARAWQERVEAAREKDLPFEPIEVVVRTRGGDDRFVMTSAAALGGVFAGEHLVVLFDITEQKRAQDALRQAKALLRAIVDSTPDVIWSVSPDTHALMTFNESLRSYFADRRGITLRPGLTPEELFPTPGWSERWHAFYARAAAEGPFTTEYETVAGTHVLDLRFHPMERDGTIFGISVFGRDITRMKDAEEKILGLNRELEDRVVSRTSELTAAVKELEAFSYSVSHDLRAPVRAIDGFAQKLAGHPAGTADAEGRRLLATIRNNAHRMGALIDDLLELSRTSRREMKRVPLDMERLVKETLTEGVPSGVKERVTIRVGALPPAGGDRALVKIVLENLVSNAVKYTGRTEHPVIEIGARPGPGGVAYFVKDNGAGFDMKFAGKLFGVFQRLHGVTEFEGTGVGLALVKRIVERHGGTVGAEGETGRGATFWFTLVGD